MAADPSGTTARCDAPGTRLLATGARFPLGSARTGLDRTRRGQGRRMLGWRSLGRQFECLWAAYAVSSFGTGFAFGAFPLIAIVVLHASPAEVSALAAVGTAVGAAVAGAPRPWVGVPGQRPVVGG